MGFILLNLILFPLVLANLPWVQSKGYKSCVMVSVLATIFQILIWVFTSPLTIGATMIAGFIPFIGEAILIPVLFFVLSLIVSTLALFIADQIVEDFEIKTMEDTFKTAVILGIISSILNSL